MPTTAHPHECAPFSCPLVLQIFRFARFYSQLTYPYKQTSRLVHPYKCGSFHGRSMVESSNPFVSMVESHICVNRLRVCPCMQMHLFSMPIHSRLGCFHSLFTHRVNRPPGLLIHANVHLSMVYHASSLPIRLFHVNICPQLDLCIKQLREFSMAVHLLNIALSCFHSDLVHLCE